MCKHVGVWTTKGSRKVSRKVLEKPARESESLVSENLRTPVVSGVPRDTWNLAGRWGDHPPRLNTIGDR